MIEGVQKILLELGKSGCYFLSICQKLGKSLDETVDAYLYCVNHKLMDTNCYIRCPLEIVEYLTGEKFRYKYSVDGDPNADIDVVKYIRNGQTHFVLEDWDSYGKDSAIRKYGTKDSHRLFYRI